MYKMGEDEMKLTPQLLSRKDEFVVFSFVFLHFSSFSNQFDVFLEIGRFLKFPTEVVEMISQDLLSHSPLPMAATIGCSD